MTKRFSCGNSNKKNRKQRKAQWIRARNLMRKYPDCSYNGDFYCNHVYEPENPWRWVDFRFFHTRLKRYFAVTMTTLEYSEMEKDDNAAYEIVCKEMGDLREGSIKAVMHPKHGKIFTFDYSDEDREFNYRHIARQIEVCRELAKVPRIASPSITIKDYGPVSVGVKATVNTQHIDEHVIREFIARFRELGEPTTPGWTHQGEEIEVIPGRLNRVSSIEC